MNKHNPLFWIAIVTLPLWILPAIAVGVVWLVVWAILRPAFIWGVTLLFAAIGQDEWADRVAGWAPDLWE